MFAEMHSAEDGVPDGMKVDTDGRVYCTGAEGVWVFEPDGSLIGIIRLPEIPANCAWGRRRLPNHVLHRPQLRLSDAHENHRHQPMARRLIGAFGLPGLP